MGQNNIDKLFNKHLRNHQMSPGSANWDMLQARLHKKNNHTLLYKVATAAVFVVSVASAWLWVREMQQPTAYLLAKVDHPVAPTMNEMPNFDNTYMAISASTAKKTLRKISAYNGMTVITPVRKAVIFEKVNIPLPSLKLEKIESPKLPRSSLSFKITYIAGNPPKQDTTKRIRKFITMINNLTPLELLGSLRQTKNDFLSGTFQKKRSSNTF